MEEHREDPSHQEEKNSEETILRLELGTTKENLLPKTIKLGEKPLAHGASSSVDQESQNNTEAAWDHYLHISLDTSHYMEAVVSMFTKIYGRKPGDPMKDLDVNLAIWGMFINTTLRAAVHLGKDYEANLRCVKNHLWKTAGQLFRETEKLISGQTETTGPSVIDFQDVRWMSTSLSIFHCQSLRHLRLCTLFRKDGRRSFWILEKPNSMVFGQQLFLRFESNWWTTCGIRVEDFPRTHYNGNPQSDSTDDVRIAVWTRELHRQDHVHVNV